MGLRGENIQLVAVEEWVPRSRSFGRALDVEVQALGGRQAIERCRRGRSIAKGIVGGEVESEAWRIGFACGRGDVSWRFPVFAATASPRVTSGRCGRVRSVVKRLFTGGWAAVRSSVF